MSDDVKKTPFATKQKPDPFFQDELDVYEAVFKLEQEKGKKILTDEQREKLMKSGRVSESSVKEINTVVGEEEFHTLKTVILGLIERIMEDFKKNVPEEEWNDISAGEKEFLSELLFKLRFGVYPGYWLSQLQGEG